MEIDLIDLGYTDYNFAFILQKKVLEQVTLKIRKNTLIFCEHPHTITLGRRGSFRNLLISKSELERRRIKIYKVDRGGDITYHGPGQLLFYPILDLSFYERDIRKFLRRLEFLVVLTLRDFGIRSQILEGFRGVWVGDKKICSIGVGIKNWVSFHGLSLNVNTDLNYFNLIRPCGLNIRMTSMEEILKAPQDMNRVKERILENFKLLFSLDLIHKREEVFCGESYFTGVR
jgi:lipoate-protein ligase B